MKYLILFALLISGAAYGQTTYIIRADSTKLQKVGGNNELILENGTRTRTGAYLKNRWNGRTEYAYAVDSMSISGSTLTVWRGGGTQNISVGLPATATSVPISGLTAATAINAINNADFGQRWQWNSLTNGAGLVIESNSTAANTNTQKLLVVDLNGANANASQTTYAATFSNVHTGTSSTNIAAQFNASGGTINNAINISAGAITLNGSAGTASQVLTSAGANTLPTWSTITPASLGAWSILGNSGTTAGTNFLGTTDGQALSIKTNSVQRLRVFQDSIYMYGNDGVAKIKFYAPDTILGATTKIKLINHEGFDMSIQTGDEYLETYSNGFYIRSAIPSGSGGDNVVLSVNGAAGQIQKLFEVVDNGTERFSINPAGVVAIGATPTTSAGTYDVLTRNTSTGVLEKVTTAGLDARYILNQTGQQASSNFNISGAGVVGTTLTVPAVYGSAAANGDITIEGTSSATKATSYVILQPTGGNVGIGISAPTMALDIAWSDATGANAGLHMKNSSTNTSNSYAGVLLEAQNGTVAADFFAAPTTAGILPGGGAVFRTQGAHQIALQTNSTTRWTIGASTGHFLAGTHNTYDIGTSVSVLAPRNVFAATSVVSPVGTFATSVTTAALTATGNVGFTGSAAVVTVGGGATAAELRFLEPSASGTNYSAFKSVAMAGNITYSLPPTAVAGGVWTDVAGNGVLTSVVPSAAEVLVIDQSITATNNTGTTETDLQSITTGVVLLNNEETLYGKFSGTFNDVTATSQIKLKVTNNAVTTTIFDSGTLTVSSIGGWTVSFEYFRTGATTTSAIVNVSTPGASTSTYTVYTDLTGLDNTLTTTIKMTGQAGGASGGDNDITGKLVKIFWAAATVH